jgi:hypothetical protein
MALMLAMAALLLLGLALSVWWGSTPFRAGDPVFAAEPVPVAAVTRRYGRAFAVGIVGGFWTGLLVTGPAVRLIMRLLAVTAGASAQGRRTEAEATIGEITVGGTISLIIFGGVLTALASGLAYVIVRPLLPAGRLGGVVFGVLHFVLLATVLDPLRPDNADFDLVGPNWLAIVAFGVASVVHGMAVAAFANRYSQRLPGDPNGHDFIRAGLPLALPLLFVAVSIFGAVVAVIGLLNVLLFSRIPLAITPSRSRTIRAIGRVALALGFCVALPGLVIDLADISDRGASDEHVRILG